jgi:hypothetical protein
MSTSFESFFSKYFIFDDSYNPALNPLMARPPVWPPRPTQAWYPQPPPVSVPPMAAVVQPLFPIHNVPSMPAAPGNVLQTSSPMVPPGVPLPVATQVSQPLFPVNTSSVNGTVSSSFVASVAPGTIQTSSPAPVTAAGAYGTNNLGMLIFTQLTAAISLWCNVLDFHFTCAAEF